jgi:hypothetical protein
MKHHRLLLPINVALAVAVVGVLLGCGGDPVDPPKGSLEAKLQGEWRADPLPATEIEPDLRHTTRTIDISYWNGGKGPNEMHTSARYRLQPVLKDVTKPEPEETTIDMGEFNYDGQTATSDVPREDGSVWVLRLDESNPKTLYVTLKTADGSKRLDEVKFRQR